MTGIYCEVSKNNYDVKMKFLYVLDECVLSKEKLYNILYEIYGIKHVKILDEFEYKNKRELDIKYTGYINLTTIWKDYQSNS
jgi:hypothetical protein